MEETQCEFGIYIENNYRCKLTGAVCIMDLPNSEECLMYDKTKESHEHDREE